MDLLSTHETETEGLAQICYNRTHGNPFFLIRFITHLREQELLEYNFGLFRWIWDTSDAESKTSSTANVVDFVKIQMQDLPTDIVRLLPILACLGASVQDPVAATIWMA
jgi:predicted ATPase